MKISVITVTLNAEKFLRNTIESVTGQDYSDYEYILIDGRSKDQTLSIIEEYAARNSKIRFKSEFDNGISDAMNKGAMLANGDILVFIHSDDYFADSKVLGSVVRMFETHPGTIWVTGSMLYVDVEGRTLKKIAARRFSYRRLLRGNIILHPATFIRRDTFINCGGFATDLRYAMDYDMWLRIGKIAPPLVTRDVLACFRVHAGSVSCRHSDVAFEEEWEVRKRELVLRKHSYPFHYGYYVLKKTIHGRYLKSNIYQ